MVKHTSNARFLKWLHKDAEQAWGLRPDDFDPEKLAEVLDRIQPIFGEHRSYFRPTVHGFDNVPEAPSLLVSNHSGGTTIPDAWGFMFSWYRHFGTGRPLHALAHEMVFALRGTAEPFSKLGVLRANRTIATEVLTEWKRDLAVMPGGDLDTWRPWSQRYKVRFSGRKGYAKLAIKTQTPIVPVANAGAHQTLMVLTDGRRMARKLHFPELFRASVFPVHLSLPFGLTVGPTPHFPVPTRLRYRIAPAIQPPVVDPGEPIPQEAIDALDEQVRTAMQAELDVLKQQAEQRRRDLLHSLPRKISVAMSRPRRPFARH